MSSTASPSRCSRSPGGGHSCPVTGVSFIDSPLPTPRNTRPGKRTPSVAKAWATIAGWYRNVGVTTLVPSFARVVRAPIAPSHVNENGACPSVSFQGWK